MGPNGGIAVGLLIYGWIVCANRARSVFGNTLLGEVNMRRVSIFLMVLALTVAFWDTPTQAQPVEDDYWVKVIRDPAGGGITVDGGGSGYDGGQWYEYDSGWWNQWFYNAPFDPERKKEIEVLMTIQPLDYDNWVTIAINWSTDKWPPGDPNPPLPPLLPGPEEDFIGRYTIFDGPIQNIQTIWERIYILDYNPEWVSIDVRGYNFEILDTDPGKIWHECLPVKWKQLPDTTPNGIDIKVDHMRWLADDFLCTSQGNITGVHLWGSWLYDDIGTINYIHLSIHDDDPVGPGGSDPDNDFSKPDQLRWEGDFYPSVAGAHGGFMMRLYYEGDATTEGEYWWDPVQNFVLPNADRQIYQIDIDISEDNTFFQEGTPDDPKIYWLDVRVETETGEFGWKTRRWPDHFMDDAVFDYGSELPRTWRELRYPPEHPYHGLEQDSIDLAFVIQGKEAQQPKPPFAPVKWSQPPVPFENSQYPNAQVYIGWDEKSVLTYDLTTEPIPICADDFYCLGPKPVTKIHWWGSFLGWPPDPTPGTPPPDLPPDLLPPAFQIAFWTDVPVGSQGNNFSYPGEMIHEIYCENYDVEFYGWDAWPSGMLGDAKYQFLQEFDKEEWFWQNRNDEIYWVSIAADYGPWSVDPPTQHLWGWETRPHFFMDDAVRIFPGQDNMPPHLGYKLHLSPDGPDRVEPIVLNDESWDLSYELGTDPNYIKWAQPLDLNWPWNEDKFSQARYDSASIPQNILYFESIVADDWPCQNPWPVTSIEWWGSYFGYDGSPGVAPPRKPDFFLLSIWTDKPADPASYSQPDQRVWTYRAYDYVQVPVGKETLNDEVVFKYYVNLPVKEYFFQEENPDGTDTNIYWLSVVAVYPRDALNLPGWGWTNHKHVFMDDAVGGDPLANLWEFYWFELFDATGESADQSFVIETEPGCYNVGKPRGTCSDDGNPPYLYTITPANYAAWVAANKPLVWCCPWQPCGDANGDGYVNSQDYLAIGAKIGSSALANPREDVNHDGFVNSQDYLIVGANIGRGDGVTPCPPLP
jgi:dockerin type I repeat protein